jgi:hypothetical protein
MEFSQYTVEHLPLDVAKLLSVFGKLAAERPEVNLSARVPEHCYMGVCSDCNWMVFVKILFASADGSKDSLLAVFDKLDDSELDLVTIRAACGTESVIIREQRLKSALSDQERRFAVSGRPALTAAVILSTGMQFAEALG